MYRELPGKAAGTILRKRSGTREIEPQKEEMQVSFYEMRQVEETQIPEFIQVIQERIDWMESRGMKQWNDEEYLDFYSEEYFRAQARAGHLFFLIKEGKAAGVTALLEEDDRWEDGSREYFYVHHLASRTGIPGAGSAFLELIEDYARKQGKRGIRLDCQLGNEPLNRFYERNGYVTVGEPFTAGGYTGIRKVLEF